MKDGADELDFVVDYVSYKKGLVDHVKEEIESSLKHVVQSNSRVITVKWIIETAALTNEEKVGLCKIIKDIASKEEFKKIVVYVKTSTGFFKRPDGNPINGATVEDVKLLHDSAYPLPIKASGGIKSAADGWNMVNAGATRLGTSSGSSFQY
eukprot:TRINITY_DN6412_c0_g1_i3.p1 TRINITY_DN6412_c0_g1~~TRINITY_DN6412_c0_g1_i3.p1  ORF type:complete len:152 (+),score=42.76 TRINITY_DN6412_c0_g1_i3:377-832(+)